jgi:ferrochelatase
LLADALGKDYTVHLAMRYKNSAIPNVLAQMKKLNYSRIVVLPMFPQYASASTGFALEMVMDEIGK